MFIIYSNVSPDFANKSGETFELKEIFTLTTCSIKERIPKNIGGSLYIC